MNHSPKTVVIVGCGFAGLNAAKTLGGCPEVEVVVVDRQNHHLFQPLLYQVAMAGLSPAEIAAPIRGILSSYSNIRVFQGEAQSVEFAKKAVKTDFGDLPYDYLILACGARHSYFGRDQWEEFAPGLKSLSQATEIRRRVLTAFEEAEREANPEKRKKWLSFVIVGGGPTGVELAGAIGEMSRYTLARDFRNIDPKLTRVILVEAGARILPSFDPTLAAIATRNLESLGVQIWTSSLVTQVDANGVSIGDERVVAATVLWAAGVEVSALNKTLGVPLGPQGRVIVEPDMSIATYPEVFVAGDQANFSHQGGKPLPGLAPVALQEGKFIARNILRELRGEPRQSFRYYDKGQMATVGRGRAIMQSGNLKMSGFLAWIAWLLVHVYYLVGFKNRISVVFHWALAYLTFRRGARLIVSKEWRSHVPVSRES